MNHLKLTAILVVSMFILAACGGGSSSSGGGGTFLVPFTIDPTSCGGGRFNVFHNGEGPINRDNKTGEIVPMVANPSSTIRIEMTAGMNTVVVRRTSGGEVFRVKRVFNPGDSIIARC